MGNSEPGNGNIMHANPNTGWNEKMTDEGHSSRQMLEKRHKGWNIGVDEGLT